MTTTTTLIEQDAAAVALSDAVADARAMIGAGFTALRLATEGDDLARARAFTTVLRDLVGAGPRDSDSARWVGVLRRERQDALRRLSKAGSTDDDLARACWMTSKRVQQLLATVSIGRKATGNPTGRPKGTRVPTAP